MLNIADCRIKTVASCAVAAVAKRQQIKISLLLYVRGCPGLKNYEIYLLDFVISKQRTAHTENKRKHVAESCKKNGNK